MATLQRTWFDHLSKPNNTSFWEEPCQHLTIQQNEAVRLINRLYACRDFSKYVVVKGKPGTGKREIVKYVTAYKKVYLALSHHAAKFIKRGRDIRSYFGIDGRGVVRKDHVTEGVYFVFGGSQIPLLLFHALWRTLRNRGLLVFLGGRGEDFSRSARIDVLVDERNFRFPPDYEIFLANLLTCYSFKKYIRHHFPEHVLNKSSVVHLLRTTHERTIFISHKKRLLYDYIDLIYKDRFEAIGAKFFSMDDKGKRKEVDKTDDEIIAIIEANNFTIFPKLYYGPGVYYTPLSKYHAQANPTVELVPVTKIFVRVNYLYDKDQSFTWVRTRHFTPEGYLLQFFFEYADFMTIADAQTLSFHQPGIINIEGCSSIADVYTAFSRFRSFSQINGILM